jgi:hypothetical protein
MSGIRNSSPVNVPRRFLIRLPRPLWIGLAAAMLVIAGMALIVLRYYLQGIAIHEINAAGGSVEMRPRWPGWLRERLDDERLRPFDEPVSVKLSYSRAGDETLGQLSRLPGLKRLDCNGAKISDAGLAHIGRITSLEWLWLADTSITDSGLAELKRLTSLRELGLNGTQVSDAGLVHLQGLTGLRELWLNGTGVTDKGLVHLKELRGLEWLFLRGTHVSDDGIADLKRAMPALQISR